MTAARTSPFRYTYRHVMRHGGYGDRILAEAHDWSKPWYVDYHTRERIYFHAQFRAPVGRLSVDPVLYRWARQQGVEDYILVEPHVKGSFSATNKDWGWQRWQQLVDRRADFAQCAPRGMPFLSGVEAIETPTFYHACALLALARGIVTSSGGLHLAAAAFERPAVVIWGSFSDPRVLGYPFQRNFYVPDPEGLGQRRPHPACARAMAQISVAQVAAAVTEAFGDAID